MRAKGKRGGLLRPNLGVGGEQQLGVGVPAVGVTDDGNNTQMLEEFHAAIMQSMGESAFEARQSRSRRMRGTLYRRAMQMSDGEGDGDADQDGDHEREHELDDADGEELERHAHPPL